MSPPARILETCLYADDLPAAHAFYHGVLGFRLHSREPERHLFYHCGDGMLLIFNPSVTQYCHPEGIPCHGSAGAEHVCWAASPDELAAWRQRLEAADVRIEHTQTWANGAQSIYFRDPAGNSLEFATPNLWANQPE